MSLENQKLPGTAIEANSISELELSSNLLSLIQAGGGPKVISYSFSSGNTLNDIGGDTVTLTGSNFDSNIEISIDGNAISNITVTNSSSLSFTTQQFSNTGNFLIFLRNPDGSSTVAVPEIEVIQYVYTFQGTVNGYTSGGRIWAPGIVFVNTIDKFPFSSDANATDVGDLSQTRSDMEGQSSATNGYTSGGFAPPRVNTIDKFPFSSDANATDVGDLSQTRSVAAGQSSSTNGYTSGGFGTSRSNTIDKFPFASDANATDVGDLTLARSGLTGHSSNVSGYSSGGYVAPPSIDPSNYSIIDKFPFASDANATDVGDVTTKRFTKTGQSSESSGYVTGGTIPAPSPIRANIIEKFSFASDENTTDVGDLTEARYGPAGQSSAASGYSSGGVPPVGLISPMNTIDKFPFATDANATDVGDLVQGRYNSASQQV